MEPTSLTEVEVLGLDAQFNFADGHAYQDLSASQKGIINRLENIWGESASLKVKDSEHLYFEAFWRLAQSPSLKHYPHFNVCPTASNSIDIMAAWLAEKNMSVGLLHPTFDNLYLLLKRRGVEVEPIDEGLLHENAALTLHSSKADAIFLVNPNNPTGKTLTEEQFKNIVQVCLETKKTLLLDNTFRFFVSPSYDQYKILLDSGVSFISIEDTGKVWPTQDMKASLIIYSADVRKELALIYEEIYLCVSNFTLGILREFLTDAKIRGLDEAVWKEVQERRDILRAALKESPFAVDPVSVASALSVEWIRVHDPFVNDLCAMEFFQAKDLMLLPGRKFYWNASSNPKYHRNVRVSLLKPRRHFLAAVRTLSEGLQEVVKGGSHESISLSVGT